MKNSFFLVVFLILLFPELAVSQSVILKGKAVEYSGLSISVFSYSDFISEEKTELGEITFQTDGSFSLKLDVKETRMCFAEFETYQAMIYVEPGKTYEIKLPPRKERTDAQKRNPFFKPFPVWFKIINQSEDDLNLKIKQFELAYRELEDQHFNDIFVKKSSAAVSNVQEQLRKQFPKTECKFFEDHKKYRMGNLEFALHHGKSNEFVLKYFGRMSPRIHLLAYQTLFNQVFNNYFSFLGNSIHGQKIKSLINTGDVVALEKYLIERNAWTSEICQLVILKGLRDAYHSGQFSKKSVINMLEQIIGGKWNAEYKNTAGFILKKITYLMNGSAAPDFTVKKINGQVFSLSAHKGKIVYLHFTDLQNPVCQQHMEALNLIAKKYTQHLVVITLLENEIGDEQLKKCAGICAMANEKLKGRYKVKTLPSSFLIDRNGILIDSPALNPLNGVDGRIGKIMEQERIEKLRTEGLTE